MRRRLVLAVFGVLLGVPAARAVTRYVSAISGVDTGDGTDPTQPLKTIQYAVDLSTNGDVICIASYELYTTGFPPVVVSNQCIYTGTGSNVVAITNAVSLSLRGGYIYDLNTHIWTEGLVPSQLDGEHARRCLCITAGDGTTNEVRLLAFRYGEAERGGNVYVSGGEVVFAGTPCEGGGARRYGGGFCLESARVTFTTGNVSQVSDPMMSGLVLIKENSAGYGGGGLYLYDCDGSLSGLGVWMNMSSNAGGGIYVHRSSALIVGGAVRANTADSGAGFFCYRASGLRIVGLQIYSNSAAYGGGGFYFYGPWDKDNAPVIANCYIRENSAGQQGGAMYAKRCTLGIVNDIIAGNTSSNGVAGIDVYASALQFYETTMADHSGGPAVFLRERRASIWPPCPPWPSRAWFTNTIFVNNDIALYVRDNGYPDIFQNRAELGYTIWWENGTNTTGGGIIVHNNDLYTNPLLTSATSERPYHLQTNSPAIDAGTDVPISIPGTDILLDIDGELRPHGAAMDIGADEYIASNSYSVVFVPAFGSRTAAPGDTVTNLHYLLNSGTESDSYQIVWSNSIDGFTADVAPTSISLDGQSYTTVTVTISVPTNAEHASTNVTALKAFSTADSNRMALAQDYTTVDTNTYEPTTRYVWPASPSPQEPYTNWDTAGHDIQTVLDICIPGDTVIVTDGVYAAGGAVVTGQSYTTRIVIPDSVTVCSVNGPDFTTLEGGGDWSTPGRCAYLGAAASLAGFTLTNGFTPSTGSNYYELVGGGAYLEPGAVISNCVVTGNGAYWHGGGLYLCSNALAVGCNIAGNVVTQGYGGGVYCESGAELRECTVEGNRAANVGGGVAWYEVGGLRNCLVRNNSAGGGAGLYAENGGKVVQCTIVTNSASASPGGGIYGSGVTGINSIVFFNQAAYPPWDIYDLSNSTYASCCSPDVPTGSGNTTNDPCFRDRDSGDLRLAYGSPCIDTADPLYSPPIDLDNNARPIDGDFDLSPGYDMGCYEYDPQTADSDADGMDDSWEHGYGLNPTNAADASADPDGDHCSNLHEYRADTVPTDAASYFHITAVGHTNSCTVSFSCTNSRVYTLEYSEALTGATWSVVSGQVQVPGEADGEMSLTDPTDAPLRCYRIRVEYP